MIKGYKTVIFDFDGTLADSLAVFVGIMSQLANNFQKAEILKTPISQFRNKTILQLVNQFKIPFYRLPFLLAKGRKLFVNKLDEIKLFPKIDILIWDLNKKRVNIGILSTNSDTNIKKILAKYNLEKYFNFIHCELNIFGKDKALSHLIEKYQLIKNETIYVGDEVRDIEACKKTGVKIIAVSWGFNSALLLKKYQPDFLVDHPEDISKII